MTTAAQIINTALRLHLNRLSPGETVDSDTLALCLDALNEVIDEINATPALLWREVLVLSDVATTGQTLVYGTTWTGIKPGAAILGLNAVTASDEWPLDPITMQELQYGFGSEAEIPLYYAFDGYSTIHLRAAAAGHNFRLRVREEAGAFADTTTDYTLTHGYKSALSVLLADRVGPVIVGNVPPRVARDAQKVRHRLRQRATRPDILNARRPKPGAPYSDDEDGGEDGGEGPDVPSYTALLPTGVPVAREFYRISFDELTLYADIAEDPSRTSVAASESGGGSATAEIWQTGTGSPRQTYVVGADDLLSSYDGMGMLVRHYWDAGAEDVALLMQFPIDKTPYAYADGDIRSLQFVQAARYIMSGSHAFVFLKDGLVSGSSTLSPAAGFNVYDWQQPEIIKGDIGTTDADILRWNTDGLGIQAFTIGEVEIEIGTWPDLSGTGTVSVGGGSGVITGAVGRDTTGDGVADAAIFGVSVLLKSGPTTLATAITSAAGVYRFENVPDGSYTVEAVDPTAALGISTDTASVTSASDAQVANFVKETPAVLIWGGGRVDSSPNDYRVELTKASEQSSNGAIKIGHFRGEPTETTAALTVASNSVSLQSQLTVHFWYQIKRRVNGEKRWLVTHTQDLSTDGSSHPFAFFVGTDATYAVSFCNASGAETVISTTVDAVECAQVHHALVVDGDAVRYYINGALEGSATISPSGAGIYPTATHVVVGAWSANHAKSLAIQKGVEGWLGGLSVTPGHALYSGASFTPPICPVTAETCTVVTPL